ncbi:hypothetical protein MYCGRDRAFT_51536 [Paecilomyces variotii No. 5]|uniref:Alpha/beta hydrolase fold-3 domain-containing protein n=1 Tax=Byssochlamys spectabilis (strain No. 5 / NBRC 109023) TaxID=1356009 RepID=V5FSJ3_BYSSN|nr:hypothetical protein MYCGRDRAFT_51536 [Paecilomyces variotii No. 5]
MSRSAAHDERNKALREVFSSPFALAATATPTAEIISNYAKERNIEHRVEEIPNSEGARLHWLGNPSARKVVLYYHGGGFAVPILRGHLIFWSEALDKLSAEGKDVLVAFLEYGLTKDGVKFPVQVLQGTEALREILEKGFEPQNIIVAGDSAGANLVLAVISVILHPFEAVQPLRLKSPLAGLLLISPWTKYDNDSQSWDDNASKDATTKTCVSQLSSAYVLPEQRNPYSEPSIADATWWRGIPANKILNIYGGYEGLKDDTTELGRKLLVAGNPVENVECPMQVHIDFVLDAESGLEPGLMTSRILDWLSITL